MKTQLFLIAALSLAIAGCGGGDPPAGPPAGQAAAQPSAVDPASAQAQRVGRPEPVDRGPSQPEAAPPTGAKAEPAEEPAGAGRRWKDASGAVLAVGEFMTLMDGNVCIATPDGLGDTVPFDKLCLADQEFVRGQSGGDVGTTAEEPVPDAETPSAEATADSGPPRGTLAKPEVAGSTRRRKVVIPFDFQSSFKEGKYGQQIAEMVLKKIERDGGFLIPESIYDVRDVCEANNYHFGPDTPLEEVKRAVRETFAADIGVWGRVELAPGHELEIYDLTIKCVDFSHEPDPKVIYEKTARTNSVSEIPHLYVKQMLDELYEREDVGPAPIDALAEENWKNNPNLITGGDFERGSGGVPNGWDSRGGQNRDPLGGLVKWTTESGYANNKVIRFEFGPGVGNGTGVMYYSDWFPVEEGARYRFQCRYRTNGPTPKVFIKCYAEMGSEYRPEDQRGPSGGSYVPEEAQRRECYRSQQQLKGSKNAWHVHTEDFTPKHTKYTPKWGRVDLYAYLGGGVVEWDDVVLKQIVPASPSASHKDPRHSMESDVTIEEMRENERRGEEAREKLREGEN